MWCGKEEEEKEGPADGGMQILLWTRFCSTDGKVTTTKADTV